MNTTDDLKQEKKDKSSTCCEGAYVDISDEELEQYIEIRRIEFRREWESYISQYE